MRILMLGIAQRSAALELREKVALAGDRLAQAVHAFHGLYPTAELVVISTCNRTELYVARPEHEAPDSNELRQWLADFCETSLDELTAGSVHRDNEQAVAHLFHVATGLESMVLGEPQILGQVKRAYEQAQQFDAVGPVLHRVFQQCIAIAKQVRAETGIDVGRVSVATVAVDFIRQVFASFHDKTIVGIGAGEMAKITLQHLRSLKPARLWLTNRSPQRALALAQQLKLEAPDHGARAFEDLDQLLIEADIVITGTGATQPIITADRFKPLLRKRRLRPLCIIDIAVPRDVEPAVGNMSNVYLYNIDDLQSVVAGTHEHRAAQVGHCEQLLAEAVRSCTYQIQHANIGQLIRQLRQRLHAFGQAEEERTQRKLAHCSPGEVPQVLSEHTHRLINKILHLPLSQLDSRRVDVPLAFYAAALRRLFQLEEQAKDIELDTDDKQDDGATQCGTDVEGTPPLGADADAPTQTPRESWTGGRSAG